MPHGLFRRNWAAPAALSRWVPLRYEQAMARDPSGPPFGKTAPSRRDRLAEALKANLRRRKAQRRARQGNEGTDKTSPQDEAGRR
jgi:hypothetical protein